MSALHWSPTRVKFIQLEIYDLLDPLDSTITEVIKSKKCTLGSLPVHRTQDNYQQVFYVTVEIKKLEATERARQDKTENHIT